MKLKIILFFLVAFSQNLTKVFAAETKLSGNVLDSLSESAMENATIQLYFENKVIESELSKADGSFEFSLETKGFYSLTVSHIGYKTQNIPIKIESDSAFKITIKLQLEGVDLQEISVKANRPLVSQKNGQIIYQIEGGIWQNSGNGMSIINRIPVLKGRSGSNYLLFGSKVTFLLDGKPIESEGVSLDVVLANIGTTEIENIEILQSPPPSLARFGNPIVNIKTIKHRENGSFFNLNHGFGRSINNRFNNAVKYSLKQNNLLLGLSVAQSQINQESKINSAKASESLNFTDNKGYYSEYGLYDIKFSGELGNKKIGSFVSTFEKKNISEKGNSNTTGYYQIKNILDDVSLFSNDNSTTKQNVASFDYNKSFSQIFNIKSAIQFGNFNTKTDENFTLKRGQNQTQFVNPWERKISFTTYYFENETTIGKWKITEGINFKNSESKTNFYKNVGTEANASSLFNYKEKVFSGFLTSNYSKDKSDLSFGLNLESTNIEGISPGAIKKLNFLSFLPTFTYNFQISEANNLTFAYVRGIRRPDYEWLNQQELYKNPYTKDIGGGVLSPSISNKFSITSTFENGLTLTGIYSNQKNRNTFFPFLTTYKTINYTAINLKNFYYLYYSAAFQKYLTKIWYFSTDVSGFYSNIKSPDYNIKIGGFTQQFSLVNYLTFKKIGQFGLTSSYNTTNYSDAYQFLPQFSVDIEYSKSIFKKKGTINISLSDLSNSLKDRFRYNNLNLVTQDNYKFETRILKLSLNYKLGKSNVKADINQNSKNESELDRLK